MVAEVIQQHGGMRRELDREIVAFLSFRVPLLRVQNDAQHSERMNVTGMILQRAPQVSLSLRQFSLRE